MDINLQEEVESLGKEKLAEIKKILYTTKQAEMIAKDNLKDSEARMAEELAMSNQLYKSDGKTLDVGAIKKPILKSAIEVYQGEPDKLAEKLDIQDSYINDIKNESLSKAAIDSYITKSETAKEASQDKKDAQAELMLTHSSDLIKAIALIVDQEVKEEEDKLKEERGEKVTQSKDNSDLLALIQKIKQMLKLG